MYFPDLSGNFSCARQAGTAEPGQAGSLDGFSTIHPLGCIELITSVDGSSDFPN
jgi:hypothetical protein